MNPVPSSNPERNPVLDREIEAALAVDPSPEFASRVRHRIAVSPDPSAWTVGWTGWKLLVAGPVAAAIVLAVVISRPRPTSPIEETKQLPVTAMVSNLTTEDLPAKFPSAPIHSPESRETPGAKSQEPEVLISLDEAAAIRRLLSGPPIQWIEISMVDIEPQSLPETPVTAIPMFDPFRTEPSAPVTASKGDNQ